MKKVSIIVAIVFVCLCIAGWIMVATNNSSEQDKYNEYIKVADSWFERGLYQRAIGKYELAIKEKATPELYKKVFESYKLRYEEAPEATYEEYKAYLERVVAIYPAEKIYVDVLIPFYMDEQAYYNAYSCLKKAIESGYDSKENRELLQEVRFKFDIERSVFSNIVQYDSERYCVINEDLWNTYDNDNGYAFDWEYKYIGPVGASDATVVTGKDSRLISTSGFVMGIFKEIVTQAGMFSDGLVPAKCNGEFSYYDEFADKKFGGYDLAGSFQDGFAAVKKDGKWMLIDKNGKAQSKKYDEIILDNSGKYLIDGIIIAKSKPGKYGIYDKDWKLKGSIECDAIDTNIGGDMIAFLKGGKWGFFDKTGKIVIEPTYENAKSFSHGLAGVCVNGKWGFIDKAGTLVIDTLFDDVGYMSKNGVCPVKTSMKQADQIIIEWKFLSLELGITEGVK